MITCKLEQGTITGGQTGTPVIWPRQPLSDGVSVSGRKAGDTQRTGNEDVLQPISSSGDGGDGKQGGVSKRSSRDKTLKDTLPVPEVDTRHPDPNL